MATNRSRRLRKKLCVDEFQELGFELSFQYKERSSEAFMQRFARDAIEADDMVYGGCDEYGFVCLAHRGSVTEEQRARVDAWLKQQAELASYTISPLMDAWYPEQPINPS